MPRSVLAAALALALVVAACGGDGGTSPSASAPPATTSSSVGDSATSDGSTPSTAPAREGAPDGGIDAPLPGLPDVDVVQLSSGDAVSLASVTSAGTPTLLWFWAPHCVFCRREAPKLLEFAARHGAAIDVVGLGAQDSLDEAYGFLDDTDTQDLTMVWDRTGRSWVHYDVTNQPTVVLLDGSGQVQGTWFRDFDEGAILAAAGLS